MIKGGCYFEEEAGGQANGWSAVVNDTHDF